MKIIFTLAFILVCYHGFAQMEGLLSNPNIEWIAETELEYNFEPENLEGNGRYDYRVRKNDFSYCSESYSLLAGIVDAVEEGKLAAYAKVGGKKLTKEEISQRLFPGVDTTTYIDPETFEERLAIVSVCEPIYYDIKSCLVKQVWYYNRKTKQLANRVMGVSLMLPIYDEKSDSILEEKEVLIYVAFPLISKKSPNINQSNVPLVMETSEYLYTDSFKTLKGDLAQAFEQFFFQLPKSKAIKTYSTESRRCCNQLINQNEYEEIFNASGDSISGFNHHDYTETIKIEKRPALKFEDYKEYKVRQTWYYDTKSHQLSSTLDAIAPIKSILDDNGNLLYNQTLFYLCFSKEGKESLRR